MKVAIVGSRNWCGLDAVREYVAALPNDSHVISGGARGVDHAAEAAAMARGIPTTIFRADWKTYGKGAGPVRNHFIVCACDRLVAFWDGKSRGTANAIRQAHELGKPVDVHMGP